MTTAYDRQKQRRQRQVWWESYKAKLRCERCGESRTPCLDFHHRDPSTKLFSVAAKATSVRFEVLAAEIAKCIVLCANCHRVEHYQQSQAAKKLRIVDERVEAKRKAIAG